MKQLPLPAQRYVKSVVATAAMLLVLHLLTLSFPQPLLFFSLLGLSIIAGRMTVALPFTGGVSTLSVAYAVDFASMTLVGPNLTLYIAAAGALSQGRFHRTRNQVYETLFTMGITVITVQAAGSAFTLLQAPDSNPLNAAARPLVGAAMTYFLVHTFLTARAVALPVAQSTIEIWKADFLWTAPNYLVAAGSAGLAGWALRVVGLWAAPLLAAPIYLTYRTYQVHIRGLEAEKHGQSTSDLHLATIEALAGAIDAKDQMTNSHILRVQFYAGGLARALGIPEEETQAIKTAALLHDIGKLAIPEHILSKPGPLTPEEFQKVRIHPKVGAEIIAGVPFPFPVASLILCHHERWDGNGYPNGIAGESIPIGARILSVVDYYDAVTSVRPYHSALSREGAVDLLKHEAGRALDPTLVDIFVKKLPELVAGCEAAVAKRASPLEASATAATDPVAAAADRRATAFHNIGLAHREIYALYEIAQSMGTSLGVSGTMELISSKLTKIIPWSGCALFLQQQDADVLRCRYAAGVDAPRLLDARIRVGKGLSGWVARNRRILVNVSPRVEFEAAGVEPESRLHSAIVCPLYLGDTFIGSLALFHTEANRYNDDHRRLITSVADQAGAVIHNSIVFEQAQEDSLTDPLTSLPNRRSLFARLSHELARAQRLDSELTLIVLDIDEFKRINDTWGHHIGDECLREMATVLRGALRQYDMCVRFAGDEFIVVISDCGRDSAESKRLELQEHINNIEVEVEAFSGKRIRLKASAGAAVFPHDGRTYEELLSQADRRMYQDKSLRRGGLGGSTPQPGEWAEAAVVGSESLAGPYDPDGIRYD